MSQTAQIVAQLEAVGIRVAAVGDRLSLAPKSRVTPAIIDLARKHKPDLLAYLTSARRTPEIVDCVKSGAEVEWIVGLDAERHEADRQAKRGYDFDPTAPSHPDYSPDPGHPAYAILATCHTYGVALRIDANGDLVVGKAGAKVEEPSQPWPSLLRAIEAHLEAVARLVEGGWTLVADFPQREVA
jgi:hypothetical protein